EISVEPQGSGERVPAGAPALLDATPWVGRSGARVGMIRRLSVILSVALAFSVPLEAQSAHVDVLPPPLNAWAEAQPSVSSVGLLADASMLDLLSNGFPARLHYRLERWVSGRWFDDLKAAFEWDVILKYDVLGKKYQVV